MRDIRTSMWKTLPVPWKGGLFGTLFEGRGHHIWTLGDSNCAIKGCQSHGWWSHLSSAVPWMWRGMRLGLNFFAYPTMFTQISHVLSQIWGSPMASYTVVRRSVVFQGAFFDITTRYRSLNQFSTVPTDMTHIFASSNHARYHVSCASDSVQVPIISTA